MKLRDELCQWHKYIFNNRLVVWTQGNISARDGDHIWIKASGVPYIGLIPRYMLKVGMDGTCDDKDFKPSTDTATHLYVYNSLDVGAVVHTHSTFATAFAAAGLDIPVVLTGMADEFGGIIRCRPYAEIGGEGIGKELVADSWGHAPGATLIQNHGLFTMGRTIEEAVKRAVLAEDCAKTTYYALRLGRWDIRLTNEQINSNYERYHTRYGQSK